MSGIKNVHLYMLHKVKETQQLCLTVYRLQIRDLGGWVFGFHTPMAEERWCIQAALCIYSYSIGRYLLSKPIMNTRTL